MSIHSYLIINAAIAFAYVTARIMLYMHSHLSQKQRLIYARYCFVLTIAISLGMPLLLNLIPSSYPSTFTFVHTLKTPSSNLLFTLQKIGEINTPTSAVYSFSIGYLLISVLFIGMNALFIKYIKNIFILIKIKKESFCLHKINNIHIIFNNKFNIPFCWGYFNTHFILLPHALLSNHQEITLSLKHELQHIRQGDTNWLHIIEIFKCIFFWNPFIWQWSKLLSELQELSCDETIILNNRMMPAATYAQCLINIAKDNLQATPHHVLGIHKLTKSFLYRRVNMLFQYKPYTIKKISTSLTYIVLSFVATTVAFALNNTHLTTVSTKQLASIIESSHFNNDLLPSITPEVLNEINHIRSNKKDNQYMRAALKRMKHYQPHIEAALKNESMPIDLLVIPLVESGYQPLEQNKNPVLAAGVWQIIPETARRFGLMINKNRDDRLDTNLATKAAIDYLKSNHAQFQNWKLALIAYEIGEIRTESLIKETGSRDSWTLANAPSAPKVLKKFLALVDASLIIMHNPSLLD